MISCGTRLSPFDINSVAELVKYDELELEKIGDEKTALFIIIDDTSATYNFIASFLYTQLFSTLCNRADTKYASRGNRLPIHVRCLLDEFANSVTRSTPKTVGITDKSVA